jgi:cytochrome P450
VLPGRLATPLWPGSEREHEPLATTTSGPSHIRTTSTSNVRTRVNTSGSWGIHLCVGAPLARIEAKVAFEQLLARTSSFSIDPSAPPLHHYLSLMIRRLVALPLVLEAIAS